MFLLRAVRDRSVVVASKRGRDGSSIYPMVLEALQILPPHFLKIFYSWIVAEWKCIIHRVRFPVYPISAKAEYEFVTDGGKDHMKCAYSSGATAIKTIKSGIPVKKLVKRTG